MLSSFGFDNKSSSRGARSNSKYVLEVPRGFSVHVFKSPSPPTHPQVLASKPEYSQHQRTPSLPWKSSGTTSRSERDYDRKHPYGWSVDHENDDVFDYEHAVDTKRSKSNKPYTIYPGAIPDTYIYERSISSMSDLPGSPLSSASSDTDSTDSNPHFDAEVSSIRASSSTETLDTTALALQNRDANVYLSSSAYNSSRTLLPPSSSHHPVIPPTSARRATVESVVDSDDEDTVASQEYPTAPVPSQRAIYQPAPTGAAVIPTHPVRRNSDERSPRSQGSRAEASSSRMDSPTRNRSNSPEYSEAPLYMPPGLSQPVNNSSHRSMNSQPTASSQRYTRDIVSNPTQGLSLSRAVNLESSAAVPGRRCVRWTEGLVCPSPLPPSQRRKGWFNCRGDQLWTNDGRYRSPEVGQEYPPDLLGYPEPSAGWMNEEGVRIDMHHRLVPKPPLRSVLKRTKPAPQEQPEPILIN